MSGLHPKEGFMLVKVRIWETRTGYAEYEI
jgi:hypothetical protein